MTRPCKVTIAFVFASCFCQTAIVWAQASADTDPIVTALTREVDLFFGNLQSANVAPKDAFADLLADGPLAERSEQLNAFVGAYAQLVTTHGRFLAAKQVSSKRVGEDLVFLTFLFKTERFPIVWRIAYYRPPLETTERPDWFVVRLSFDTKIETLSESQ